MKTAELLEKKFIGTHELRKNLTRLLENLKKTNGEVVITQQGQPTAVLMDLAYYEELFDTIQDLAEPGYVEKLIKIQQEMREGKSIPAAKLYQELGLKP